MLSSDRGDGSDNTVRKPKATYTRVIAFGFLIIIFAGAALLCLPVSSKSHEWTPFFNSFFTATSATCVTGLVLYDTYSHWSIFGQIVILAMIQIGGIGFMSLITIVSIFMGRRISLHERKLIMQSAGNTKLSGMIQLVKRLVYGTFFFESVGAILLALRFCPDMGFGTGLYNAVFHSVSAFCNAGFDLMGRFEPGSSIMHYQNDILVNLTLCGLILIGGLGFMVWSNIFSSGFNYHKYSLHTKIVLTASAALVVVSTILFFIFEQNKSFAGMSLQNKWLHALFQAVTPRTAGFNTVDLSTLSESGNLLTTVLMLIGGSPGSTAGGIKTTTVVVMLLTTIASARHDSHVEIFKRRLSENTLRQASAICSVYLTAVVVSTLFICAIEPYSMKQILFEVSSAIGTVGLSTGITSSLSVVSQAILIILMYAGRVGGLSLMLVLAEKRRQVALMRPTEDILIG
ncbi:MAG: TrkH family potassium uptake protein [Clostridiales bacterium]|nr:TrkH family potassium uptake protein [Clostridiales bacterium]